MTNHQFYYGAFIIFLGLVLAGLLGQPAHAFTKKQLHEMNTTVRLNIANPSPSSNIFAPKEFDFHIGANQNYGQRLQPDNFYTKNLESKADPVEIGGIKLRF